MDDFSHYTPYHLAPPRIFTYKMTSIYGVTKVLRCLRNRCDIEVLTFFINKADNYNKVYETELEAEINDNRLYDTLRYFEHENIITEDINGYMINPTVFRDYNQTSIFNTYEMKSGNSLPIKETNFILYRKRFCVLLSKLKKSEINLFCDMVEFMDDKNFYQGIPEQTGVIQHLEELNILTVDEERQGVIVNLRILNCVDDLEETSLLLIYDRIRDKKNLY